LQCMSADLRHCGSAGDCLAAYLSFCSWDPCTKGSGGLVTFHPCDVHMLWLELQHGAVLLSALYSKGTAAACKHTLSQSRQLYILTCSISYTQASATVALFCPVVRCSNTWSRFRQTPTSAPSTARSRQPPSANAPRRQQQQQQHQQRGQQCSRNLSPSRPAG
jgi:hypothetical protein